MKLGKPVENEIWLSIMNKIKFHIGGLVFCSVSNSVNDSVDDSVRDSVTNSITRPIQNIRKWK
jgi:hypothetical protein